uniref:FACT complex subunit SSRP1-like n=1 Tax=Erigeron canadensis TaxID=72917 RepID=UPI001CB89A38|nr:FACT complex subunit SSRP1-like [Erigeron canadensis]XP_043625266.1 FACT complex subunit SSRP1-like [Erigeron canadensis]
MVFLISLNSFFKNVCKIARINNEDVRIRGEQPVVTYKSTQTLPLCGSFTLELYLSFLRIYCSVGIFKIQYSKIARVFVLLKSKIHTFVVITFHPFTKNGKTVQSHIVIKFYSGDIVKSTLVMNRDLYATKYKDKLELGYKFLGIH